MSIDGNQASTPTSVLERNSPKRQQMDPLLFTLPVQIAVLDRNGTIVATNQAWERFARESGTSTAGDGTVGMNYLAACRQTFESHHQDFQAFEAGIRAVLDGTQPLFTTEYQDGSATGQRRFQIQASPLPGNVPGAVVLHLDITERKLTEEDWATSLLREQVQRAEVERGRSARQSAPRAAAPPSAQPASIARLRALEALTSTALSPLPLEDLMRELLDRMIAVMGVDNAAILLLEEDGTTLTVRVARGPEEPVAGHVHVPVGRGFAGRIAASRQSLLVDDISTIEVVSPLLREQLRSLVGVPLLVDDRLVGVVHVGSATARHFTPEDVGLLQLVADRIAPAVEAARLYAAEKEARARAEANLARATASEALATERTEQVVAILEAIPDGVTVLDQEGHIIQSNRAFREILGTDRTPGFGVMSLQDRARILDLRDANGEPLPPERWAVARALRGEVVTGPPADVCVRSMDGRTLEVNISAAPLRDHDGHVVGAVTVTREVSWRRRLEREREEARTSELALKETAQRLDEFLAIAAHDLRSPLAVTTTAIDLAASRLERLESAIAAQDPNLAAKLGPALSCLEEAALSVERLSRMITMLFDSAQLHSGTLELRLRPSDLAEVVREQVDLLRKEHPSRTIHVETPGDLPVPVAADSGRIGQVLANYVSNAVKYSPDDQPIDVRVATEGPMARVSVRDRGPGLSLSEQERVWQRFYRVPGIRVQSGHNIGMGLGLHICKTIVEQHGGQVGVESAVGAGSAFWFTLPLTNAA